MKPSNNYPLTIAGVILTVLLVLDGAVSAQSQIQTNGISEALPEPGTFTTVDFPGATNTSPIDINPAGEIVGSYVSATDGNTHGFLRSRNGEFTSIDFPGAVLTVAAGINPQGDITGQYRFAGEASSVRHGFLLSEGEFITIDVPGAIFTNALGINDRGDIAGRYCALLPCTQGGHDGNFHGFLLSNGEFTSVDFPGALHTHAWKINPRGQMLGVYVGTDRKFHLYLLNDGEFTSIDIPGAIEAVVDIGGLNPRGDIVGGYCPVEPCTVQNRRGFLLSGGEFTSIEFPGATRTIPLGINARGEMVGVYADTSGKVHGFLWSKQ
jgi:uncharacterized membrane protein